MITNETKRHYHHRRLEELKNERRKWEPHWLELAQFNAPHRVRFVTGENAGKKIRSKILDSSSTFALRTLGSGMHSGITSPARPWFRLTTFDPKLREMQSVKEYLDTCEKKLREVFQASNLYTVFHNGYLDLGLFGQAVMLLVEDEKTHIRLIPLLHGSFWVSRDESGRADTLYRQFRWTVERIVRRFGYDNCSPKIRECYDRKKYDEYFVINHAIEPRKDRDKSKADKKNKAFLSNYWEDEAQHLGEDKLLEESGFDDNPIIAPIWERVAEDGYGVSPGMDALPDTKQLQKLQLMSGEAIEKKVRPPMKAPVSLKSNPASLMPNSITYVDDVNGRGYTAAIEVNLSVTEVEEKIRQTQMRVERAYYADLFLMLSNMEGIQPRNTLEISERKEEKLLALGPVLENIYSDQLAPVIDRAFMICNKRGLMPPPPMELQGQELQIEYISMLAQAQKAIATGSIERLFSFAGSLAGAKPDILDKLDFDEAVDQYADMLGAPPSVVVADEEVKKTREARNEMMARQAQAEQAATLAPAIQQGAQAAKILSETQSNGGGQSLLAQLGITP